MKTERTKNRLNSLLESHTWLAPYQILEIKDNDFTIYFENDNDAERFAILIEQFGANTSIHSCH